MWSFPGGKIETGEQAQQAASRELTEETGLHGVRWQWLGESSFSYPDRILHFTLFICLCSRPVSLQAEFAFIWVPLGQLGDYPMPDANREFIWMFRAPDL